MEALTSGAVWGALGAIIVANILLSGDNAVVIAMAARSLPPQQQRKAIIYGSAAAIVMRIVLTIVAVQMLQVPYLKILGALALLWIGIQLLLDSEEEGEVKETGTMGAAIRTILIADLVMSLDNVIAVAAAAGGHWGLLIIGLAISIPLVIFGATLLLKLMERWPIIITIGAGLLGFVAGEMGWEDRAIAGFTSQFPESTKYVIALIGAAFVVLLGRYLGGKTLEKSAEEQVEHLGGHVEKPGDMAGKNDPPR